MSLEHHKGDSVEKGYKGKAEMDLNIVGGIEKCHTSHPETAQDSYISRKSIPGSSLHYGFDQLNWLVTDYVV